MIHPTAIISPGAQLDPSVEVGPYAVIDAHVTLGPGCRVGPHVYLTGHTAIGPANRFHAGCVIGDAPQDLKYKDEPTRVVIGEGNVFREGCTVHRSTKVEEATVIGSHNFLMANSHVGHNAVVGNRVVLVNGALLAGHVQIADRAFISGNCLVHQFVRIGTLSLMQGGSAATRDLPPYTVARGFNNICGLNVVGLRRNGISSEERSELKKLYHRLFRSGENRSASLDDLRREFTLPTARTLLDFIASSTRGVSGEHAFSASESTGEEDEDAID